MTPARTRKTYDLRTDSALGAVRREIASALGLLVVLFNLIAATMLAATAPARAGSAIDDVLGDRITICTGSGMLVIDRDGRPVGEEVTSLCMPLVKAQADVPPLFIWTVDAPLPVLGEAYTVDIALAPARAPVIRATSPRGPPFA